MKINLIDLVTSEGKREKLQLEYDHDSFKLGDGSFPIASKKNIELTLSCVEKGKAICEGTFGFEVIIPCDRCLEEVKVPIDVDFSEEIDTAEIGNDFEIDEIIDREIVMQWPQKILCNEDCKGICMKCGQSLNEGECGCDRHVLDPRMAAFLDVFNSAK